MAAAGPGGTENKFFETALIFCGFLLAFLGFFRGLLCASHLLHSFVRTLAIHGLIVDPGHQRGAAQLVAFFIRNGSDAASGRCDPHAFRHAGAALFIKKTHERFPDPQFKNHACDV